MKALFPHALNRFGYFVRILVFFGVLYIIVHLLNRFFGMPHSTPIWIPIVVLGALFILRFFCCDIPRCRSVLWSPWLVLLFLVPIANVFMQLLLLVIPAKMPPNTALEPTPTAP